MQYVIYESRALIGTEAKLQNAILEHSQMRNRAAGLTGFLHREGDTFLQYLEGPKQAVADTLDRIRRDPRHTDIRVLDRQPILSRYLPDWQMGFVDSRGLKLSDLMQADADRLDLRQADPFDLVVFVVANAELLRKSLSLAA